MASTLDSLGFESAKTVTVTYCFIEGRYTQFMHLNEGPTVTGDLGSAGTYEVTDDHTLQLMDKYAGGSVSDHVSFSLAGDQLRLTEWTTSVPDPDTQFIVAVFSASPYTRRP